MKKRNLLNSNEYDSFSLEVENYVKNGFITKALQLLNEVIKEYSTESKILYLLGWVYYKAEEYEKALQYMNQSIHHNPDFIDAYIIAAKSAFHNNDIAETEHLITKADCIDKNHYELLLLQGEIALKNHNYTEALRHAGIAMENSKNQYEVMLFYAKVKVGKQDDFEETLEIINKVIKQKESDEANSLMMKHLYINEKYDDCLKYCNRVIAKNSNSVSAHKAREMMLKIKRKRIQRQSNVQRESVVFDKNRKASDETFHRESESLEEALQKLNQLIGLSNVKKEIEQIVKLVQYDKKRNKILGISTEERPSYHFLFTGNPGTGKTTVARLLGDILYHIDLLDKGHVVETDRSGLVGQFIGQTAQITKEAIDNAQGGILFVDEAYSLGRGGIGSNDFGPEAIDTLIKSMEDLRGGFTVILAGYKNEMRDLILMNPGFRSRINIEIEFEDYTNEELLEIARFMVKQQNYDFTKDAERAFLQKISVEQIDDHFANARSVRNIIEKSIREKAFRIGSGDVSQEELMFLKPADFGIDLEENPEDRIKSLYSELDGMTGLKNVKEMIKQILHYVQLQKKKEEAGMLSENISLHMIFEGNPGTGKTTIARLLSRLLKEIGILKKGHLVEVTREDLVAGYIGQTASKTLKKVKEAYGGVLFIDEAYTLHNQSGNDFGQEAIATIIKEMEDQRDKLVIIMAGYKPEMKQLLDVNSGLDSRINHTIEFEDYSVDELMEIFTKQCKSSGYNLTEESRKEIFEVIRSAHESRDHNFGNGRFIRNLLDKIKMRQAMRVMQEEDPTNLMTINNEDL